MAWAWNLQSQRPACSPVNVLFVLGFTHFLDMEPGELIPQPSGDQMCSRCRRSDKPLRVCGSEPCHALTCDDCSHVCPGCPKGPICSCRYVCFCGISYCYDVHSCLMRTCVHFHEEGGDQCRESTCPLCDPNQSTIHRCGTCGHWRCVGKDTVHSCRFDPMTPEAIREEKEQEAKLLEDLVKS